jgi:hypothetical protein
MEVEFDDYAFFCELKGYLRKRQYEVDCIAERCYLEAVDSFLHRFITDGISVLAQNRDINSQIMNISSPPSPNL